MSAKRRFWLGAAASEQRLSVGGDDLHKLESVADIARPLRSAGEPKAIHRRVLPIEPARQGANVPALRRKLGQNRRTLLSKMDLAPKVLIAVEPEVVVPSVSVGPDRRHTRLLARHTPIKAVDEDYEPTGFLE